MHPGNNKQDAPLALSIFDETTIAGVRLYFPDREDAASFLKLIKTWWLISNAKDFDHANRLGRPVVEGDKKVEFLYAMADWLDDWTSRSDFAFTPQTKDALTTTLRGTASLTQDLLNEGYDFVRTVRFQSDPLERYYSRCRQRGGRFLVSLTEMNNAQRIFLLTSLIRDDVNFWNEDLSVEKSSEDMLKLLGEIESVSSELLQCSLSSDTQKVCTQVTGYIVRKLDERLHCSMCKSKLVATGSDVKRPDTAYIDTISRGGLIVPSTEMTNFVSNVFALLDFTDRFIMKYPSVKCRDAATVILEKYVGGDDILCNEHTNIGRRRIFLSACNVFYNNKRKDITANIRKDQLKKVKVRQLKKDK